MEAGRRLGWAAAATLLATAGAEARTVGLALSGTDATMPSLRRGIETRARLLGDVVLRVEDAGGDADRQVEGLRRLVLSGVDAIIVAPVDGERSPGLSTIASGAGIPLVFVAEPPVHRDALPARQAYVGPDATGPGTLQAGEVCRRLGGAGRVALLMGELRQAKARRHLRDAERVFAGRDCSGIAVVERQSANGSRGQAEDLVLEWLAAGDAFEAVLAGDDEMALGAIEGLKAGAAWTDDMIVAGIDGTSDGLAAVKAGEMQVTVIANAERQGSAALDAALTLASGGVPAKVVVPPDLVTAANVDLFLAR